ncbi:MAG: arylsulfatase [Gammaproteobacteria bacterium]|nr:arylsulfatase [Gammaproteobacteria bacterium]MBT8051036.1 arylsulfatase [Gammaproteobacteria bacterium]NNJ80388.1 arylsulfatase [Xanthomonadales bacterium]
MLVPKFGVFLCTITAILCCSACGDEQTVPPDASAERPAEDRPNIVFILADDLGYGHLGSYGQEIIETPELDRLAAGGLRYTQAYAGSTVCAPSRSVLMTGQHTGHTTVRANFGPDGERIPLNDDDTTVAEVLKSAGYTTGMIGKWGLGEPGTSGLPNKQGFDHWFGFLNQHNAHSFYPPYLWRNDRIVYYNENENGQRQTYVQDLFIEEALQFIRTNKDKTFFLYLPFTLPHTELAAREDMMGQYQGRFDDVPFPPKDGRPAVDEAKATYAAMVSTLDHDIGRIMRELKQQGLADNTLVIFTSDNGAATEDGAVAEYFNGSGPLRGIKRDVYEGGIRVPLIVNWPGKIEPGGLDESSHVVFWDFLPTLAELAVADLPERLDGISITPSMLRGIPVGNERPLYWEFRQKPHTEMKQAVRWGRWKGVRLGEQAKLELYDLQNDIGETNNVAAEHPEVISRIEDFLRSARD